MPTKKTVPYNWKKLIPMAMLALTPAAFMSCDKDDEPIVKQDVRIGWDLKGKEHDFATVLYPEAINKLKSKPTTGNIYAYVYNEDGRGPPVSSINDLVNYMTTTIKPMGVMFEPGKIYVNNFDEADSIRAQQQLALTIDLWSRKK
ncbi:MAG: hypothetical protein LBJ73_01600 [Rickettsiales bacterium]|jgi:hypothetical protein|nr:hypothetical protein [Rickettsiales bacterium]